MGVVSFTRFEQSQLRGLLQLLSLGGTAEEVVKRLDQLRRGQEPEDEFSLILSWLGRCRLVHKLGQEQLPVDSVGTYRVPDLLAVFERIRMKIKKLSEADEKGGFDGLITEVYFVNASGRRIPDIPHLSSLFLVWEDEVEVVDEGDTVVQSFTISDTGLSGFASRTMIQMAGALSELGGAALNLHKLMHDTSHWVQGELDRVGVDLVGRGVVDDLGHLGGHGRRGRPSPSASRSRSGRRRRSRRAWRVSFRVCR
jgi:hypothetical protein